MKSYEVVVVGGGPAGALTAYHLARAGKSVALIERENFPRRKPCGGGITPKTAKLLPYDWEHVVEHRALSTTLSFHFPLTFEWGEPVCLMVTRDRFDAVLLEQARRAGCELFQGETVTSVEDGPLGVACRTGTDVFHAAFLVAADGAHSVAGRLSKRPPLRGMAVVAEVEADDDLLARWRQSMAVDFAVVPGGYGWVFPKDDHLNIGIGCFGKPVRPLRPFLRGYLARLGLDDRRIIHQQAFPIPFEAARSQNVGRGRIILAGDAAGLADPFTGEGIHNACLSGTLAARAIIEGKGNPSKTTSLYLSSLQDDVFKESIRALRLARLLYSLNYLVLTYFMARPELLKALWHEVYTGTYRQVWRMLWREALRFPYCKRLR